MTRKQRLESFYRDVLHIVERHQIAAVTVAALALDDTHEGEATVEARSAYVYDMSNAAKSEVIARLSGVLAAHFEESLEALEGDCVVKSDIVH